MLEGFTSFLKELDRRVKVALIGIGIYNLGLYIATQYNVLFVESLGATAVDIGLLTSIASVVKLIVSIPLGSAAEKYTVKKIMILGLIFDLISATLFALSGNWLILIPAFILSGRTFITLAPLTDITFVTVIEPQKRATVMSLSRVFWGILSIFASIAAAIIVTNAGGINAQGIRPLYYIQFALYAFVLFFMAKELEAIPRNSNVKNGELGSKWTGLIHDYQDLFKGEKYLKRWIAIRLIETFAQYFSISFIPLWIVSKGATPYILGMMTAVSIVFALIFNILAGRLADTIGRKKAFFLLAPFNYLGILSLIIAPSPEYLILAAAIGYAVGAGVLATGVGIGGASFTPFITMWWETVPAEKRGRGWGLEGFIMSIAAIPASMIAGFLWDQGFMIAVLVFPILLESLVVMPLLSMVPDTLRPKK